MGSYITFMEDRWFVVVDGLLAYGLGYSSPRTALRALVRDLSRGRRTALGRNDPIARAAS